MTHFIAAVCNDFLFSTVGVDYYRRFISNRRTLGTGCNVAYNINQMRIHYNFIIVFLGRDSLRTVIETVVFIVIPLPTLEEALGPRTAVR